MPPIQLLQSADQDSNRKWREEEANYHQHQYQEKYAGGPTDPRYAAGDWVLTKNHKLSNKVEGYNAALDHQRIWPYHVLEHISSDVYWIVKDGREQKVHGKDLWPAQPPEKSRPRYVGIKQHGGSYNYCQNRAEISTTVIPEKGITHAEQQLGTQQSIAAKNIPEMDSRTAEPPGRPCSWDNEHLPLKVAGKAFPPAKGTEAPNNDSDSSHKDWGDHSKNGQNEFRRQQPSGSRNGHIRNKPHSVSRTTCRGESPELIITERELPHSKDFEISSLSSLEDIQDDNARGRYKFRKQQPINYREARTYLSRATIVNRKCTN